MKAANEVESESLGRKKILLSLAKLNNLAHDVRAMVRRGTGGRGEWGENKVKYAEKILF